MKRKFSPEGMIDFKFPTGEVEEVVEPAPEERGVRDISFVDFIDKLRNEDETMSKEEVTKATHALERRRWGDVLRKLDVGDVVVSILSDTSDTLSIKNLNDNVFGPKLTDDEIIAKRRNTTTEVFERVLREAGVSDEDIRQSGLEHNYKFDIFRIPGGTNLDVTALMNKVCAEVDAIMREHITTLAKNEQEKNPSKKDFLSNFANTVQTQGYRMNFGTALVESADLKDVVLAVNGSLQTARASTSEAGQNYGGNFSVEKMQEKLAEIQILRNQIFDNGNTLIGQDGSQYEIFTGSKESGLALDRDLLRDVRKDKFVCAPDQKHILDALKKYIKDLNIFDLVKPFTADEFEKVEVGMGHIDTIAEGLKNGDMDSRRQAADILDTNEKDNRYTSEARFHADAVKIKNCAYISLDVLDVGVDQLLDFEQRVQSVEKGESNFVAASLEAGDAMTKTLRTMREDVFAICANEKFNLVVDGRMTGLVGGDELALAIDLDTINEKQLDKLIHQLRKKTNSRVVKTVVAESIRHSDSENPTDRFADHLSALKKAEEGAGQAKQLETLLRKLEKIKPDSANYHGTKDLAASLKDFVIAQEDHHFVVRTESGPDQSLVQILEKLKLALAH